MLCRAGAKGVPKDGNKALQYFHRACDNECFPNSCFMLNAMYLSGTLSFLSAQPCDNADVVKIRVHEPPFRPHQQAYGWGFPLFAGQAGVQKNLEKAFFYADKACSYGHPWACINASRMCKLGPSLPARHPV